jgi:hypothetical protein
VIKSEYLITCFFALSFSQFTRELVSRSVPVHLIILFQEIRNEADLLTRDIQDLGLRILNT